MICTETITATGTGTWYLAYEVSLATITSHFRSKYSPNKTIIVRYELRFRQPGDTQWNYREFGTDTGRGDFIQQAFSEITLQPIAMPTPMPCGHLLSPIVGEQLSSVTFVMDYIQIHFNQHGFSAYAWPVVWADNQRHAYGEAGYRDAVCSLITKSVTRFEEYLDAGLVFEFGDGYSLEISTSDPTGELVEVAEYHGPDGVWMVWGLMIKLG